MNSLEKERLSREVLESETVDFRVINPPAAGLQPVAPNRVLLLVGVLLVSFGLGGGLAWLLSEIKASYHSSAALQFDMGLPVIGSVARSWSHTEHSRYVRSIIHFSLALATLILANFGIIAIEIIGPGLRSMI